MSKNRTKKNGAAASAVMAAKWQKKEALRSKEGRSALNTRQQYMLSYLNRAQMAQWNKYSPIQQRKIMEEIEKKLERKLPGDEAVPSPEKMDSAFDVDAYMEEERAPFEYRIRGHPGDGTIRLKTEAAIRQESSILRVNPASSMAFRMGDISARRASGSNASGPALDRRAKPLITGRSVKGQRKESTLLTSETALREEKGRPGISKSSIKAAKVPALQKKISQQAVPDAGQGQIRGMQIQDAAIKERGNTKGRMHSPGESRGRDIQRRNAVYAKTAGQRMGGRPFAQTEEKGMLHLAGGPPFRDDRPVDLVRRKAAITEISRREKKENSDLSFAARQGEPLKAQPSDDAKDLRKTDTEMKIRKADVPLRIRMDDIRDVPDGKDLPLSPQKPGTKPAEGEKTLLSQQEIEARKIRAMETAEKTALTKASENSHTTLGASLPDPSEDKPLVTLRQRQKEKEIFRSSILRSGAGEKDHKARQRSRAAKKEKKREAKYRKEFASLLIATIEKDMAKQANIRQAQKSGQIEATVSELTGNTGRGAVRTAALPLRLHLAFLGKKLREELKKRMKEAVRNLMRHAATFGAPVFAVVIIVMLLASICMIGTTQDQPQGTGLGFKIVQEAKKHLGLPYVYGGTSLVDGCDCSGFVWAIYNIFGYNLPRTAGDQYAYGRKVGSDVSDWQLGDLIYYSRTGSVQSGGGRAEHIVIYIGGGQVISCGPVAIYNWDYRSDYYGTCRIIPDEPLGGDFSGSTNEEICWNYFISQGFSEAAAAGILGNMYVESGGTFDPSIHQYGGGPGRGLCQWEESYSGGSGRYNNLVAFANGLGKSWDDITAQLQFVSYELDSGAMNPYFAKFGGVEAFKNSTDPTTATYVFLCGFEYCGDPGQSFLESAFSLSTRVDHAGWAYLNYQ